MNLQTKLKKWSLAKWKHEFWLVFAKYIKIKEKHRCFTCPAKNLQGQNAQAGHFQKASICGLGLYFHEDNVHCQCMRCNINLDGNQYEYGKRLGAKADELVAMLPASRKVKYDKLDYLAKIGIYKAKIKELTPNK